MEKKKRHFVLVHGACHVRRMVTALDMAASGVHPKQLNDVGSFSDYVEPLMEFMASLPVEERVMLVGHIMGGACISLAMERFTEKIFVGVYVTALILVLNSISNLLVKR